MDKKQENTMPLKQAVKEMGKLEFSTEQKKEFRKHLLKTYGVKPVDQQ
jgi:hypothetical protein